MENKSQYGSAKTVYPRIGNERAYVGAPVVPEVLLRPDIDERQAALADVIAGEIVPRLLRFHHEIRSTTLVVDPPGPAEVAEFGALAMGADIGAASIYFEKLRANGHSLDTLFVQLLAPTARYLGELWEQDRCDFVDVTIGVARLQELLSIFGADSERPPRDVHHRALLATVEDEKHLFGVDMVATFMRGAGWDVMVEPNLTARQSATVVSRDWFGVAGLTLSREAGLEALAATIRAIRGASRNRDIAVIVGGRIFDANQELVAQVGADASAHDAPTATILAKKLLIASAARHIGG